MSLGIGIVGCGMIADFHAKAIADTVGAELVAATSRREESSAVFSEKHGCKPFKTVQEMLKSSDVDIVSICTPSGAHLDPAVEAAKAGKHVIVEKPLEVTADRCDQMIKACHENEVLLSTIFPSRFHRSSLLLKQAVDAGRFGRLTMGDAYVKWFRSQEYYDSGAWRGTWKLDGGGALMNQAIHSVDLLLWLMGPVDQVSAHTATLAHQRIEVEDAATASLRFQNGALGVIQATTAAYPGMLKRIEIHGTGGSAVIEEEKIKVWDFADSVPEDKTIIEEINGGNQNSGGGAADPAAIGHHAHAAQFQDFIDAIQNGRQPAIDGTEGRKSVALIQAIYQAAEQETAIKL